MIATAGMAATGLFFWRLGTEAHTLLTELASRSAGAYLADGVGDLWRNAAR
jgi:hypothetical protein